MSKETTENTEVSGKDRGEGRGGARVEPVPASGMRPGWVKTLERVPGAGLKGRYFPSNVLGTLMHSPEIFGVLLDYWVTSKLEMGFSFREQELIILRTGVLFRCEYVWKHHVHVAREFGVSEAELAAVKATPIPALFNPREAALLNLTDELIEQRTIRPAAWDRWASTLKQSECVDLIHLVSQYMMFALTNNAMRVELEAPLHDMPEL